MVERYGIILEFLTHVRGGYKVFTIHIQIFTFFLLPEAKKQLVEKLLNAKNSLTF